MKVQMAKHRDGEKANAMDIGVDYATAYWSDEQYSSNNSGGIESLLSSSGEGLFS
jgi:hypothetical protein